MLNEFLEQLYWTAYPHSWGDVALYVGLAVLILVVWNRIALATE